MISVCLFKLTQYEFFWRILFVCIRFVDLKTKEGMILVDFFGERIRWLEFDDFTTGFQSDLLYLFLILENNFLIHNLRILFFNNMIKLVITV